VTAGFAVAFTITVHRPPSGAQKNRWGDAAAPFTPHYVDGCAIYPSGSTEIVEARDTIADTAVLLVPYGADIKATDEVEIPDNGAVPPLYRNTRWKVDGTPAGWQSPFTGWKPGTEIRLTKQAG
jgi:hypothetical protein